MVFRLKKIEVKTECGETFTVEVPTDQKIVDMTVLEEKGMSMSGNINVSMKNMDLAELERLTYWSGWVSTENVTMKGEFNGDETSRRGTLIFVYSVDPSRLKVDRVKDAKFL